MSTKSKTVELEEMNVDSPNPMTLKVNTGMSKEHRSEIANAMGKVLADTYCLMLMTQNYHWNVQGSLFRDIHLMTEEHYENIFDAVDEIAERIRALGFKSPGTMSEFNDITSVNIPNSNLSQMEMVADLLEAHETVTRSLRKALEPADNASDEATIDLITERLDFHEKTSWMLRSMLEK
jgi:starvation-inducible DNA-binding protein